MHQLAIQPVFIQPEEFVERWFIVGGDQAYPCDGERFVIDFGLSQMLCICAYAFAYVVDCSLQRLLVDMKPG